MGCGIMEREKKEMIEDARMSIKSELDRAFKGHKRVIIGLKISFAGRYAIDGYIRFLGPVSVIVDCADDDGNYAETFAVRDVRIVSVFE